MANSFRAKLKKLHYKGNITTDEYNKIIHKLDGHDREIRNDAIDDFAEAVKTAVTEMEDIGAYNNPTKRICEILEIEADRLKDGASGGNT